MTDRGHGVRRRLVLVLLAVLAAGTALLTWSACASGPGSSPESAYRELEVVADDVTLYVRMAGGPDAEDVLVAINGGPGQSSHYMANLEELASADFAVVTYDQRGMGRSTIPADGYGLVNHVADIERIRKAVGAESIHLMGHSWGGVVAMRYATIHPEKVRSIILMGSGPPSRQMADAGQVNLAQRIAVLQQQGSIPEVLPTDAGAVVQAILPAYFSDASFKVPDELKETTLSEAANRLTLSAVGDWDFTAEVATLDHPVLMLWGEDDPFGRPMAEATRTALSAAEVEFVVLGRCGHYWHECPDEFFSHVRAFLGSSPAP